MPERRSGEDIALAILTVAEVPNFFSGFLPSLWTIGHFSDQEEEETRYWIRRGEVSALALTLALGVGSSIISQSWLPFVGVVFMAGFLVYQYEHALHNGSGHDITKQRDDT